MPVLREDSVLIMDGAVKLYRRERSRKWQAAFQIDGQYIRISTGKSDLDEAKQTASDSYLEYKFRQKNGVPVVSKRFSDVAKLCITEMNKQLESGVGKKVYPVRLPCPCLRGLCQQRIHLPRGARIWQIAPIYSLPI